MPLTPPLTVYYDGACPLCAAEIRTYRRSRGAEAVAWVDVGSEPPGDPGPGLTVADARARFHVRGADGRLASGAAGFVALWGQLPAWRPLARLGSLPGMGWLAERAYRGFLPLRPYLARFLSKRAAPHCDGACGPR